jgi:pimeloyl-ACP methyl ester carboxylesterase
MTSPLIASALSPECRAAPTVESMRAVLLGILCLFLFLPTGAMATPLAHSLGACGTLQSDDGTGTIEREDFGADWQCGTVSVPADRATGSGVINLRVAYWHRPGAARNTVLALAGGPGQGAFQYSLYFQKQLSGILGNRDLLVFDQRGTGGSGYLDFEKCTNKQDTEAGYDRCARTMGSALRNYNTAASVADIEDVRQALGIPQLFVLGVSYGTKVAGDYLRSYPSAVEATVLDSPLAPTGIDPWMRDSMAGSKRIMRNVCANSACPFTADAGTDLTNLLNRLGTNGLSARLPWGKGGSTQLRLTQASLFNVLINGDFDTASRLELPGLIKSALNGDRTPLLRYLGEQDTLQLRMQAHRTGYSRAGVEQALYPDMSTLLYVATMCTDTSLPWDAGTSRSAAGDITGKQLTSTDPATFFGWNREAMRSVSVYDLCALFGSFGGNVAAQLPWPSTARTLVLVGSDDFRTTVENAQQYSPLGATVVPIPRQGHSVVTGPSTCAATALTAFANGQPVQQCSLPTTSPQAVRTQPRTTRGLRVAPSRQLFTAVSETLLASYRSNPIELFETNRAGLRGGWFTVSGAGNQTARFHRYREYADLGITGQATITRNRATIRLKLNGRWNTTVTSVRRGRTYYLQARINGTVRRFNLDQYLRQAVDAATTRSEEYAPLGMQPVQLGNVIR